MQKCFWLVINLVPDEPQGTMGRERPLSPSGLPIRAHFHRERETSGYEAVPRASLLASGGSLRERVEERWGNISWPRSEGIIEFYNISNLAIIWTKADSPSPVKLESWKHWILFRFKGLRSSINDTWKRPRNNVPVCMLEVFFYVLWKKTTFLLALRNYRGKKKRIRDVWSWL